MYTWAYEPVRVVGFLNFCRDGSWWRAQFGPTCYRVSWVYLSFCILYLYFVFVFLLFCWIVQLLSRWQFLEPNLVRLATAYHVAGQFWQQHVLASLRRICEHMLQNSRAGPIKAEQLIDFPRSLSGTTCVAKVALR